MEFVGSEIHLMGIWSLERSGQAAGASRIVLQYSPSVDGVASLCLIMLTPIHTSLLPTSCIGALLVIEE